MPLAPIAPSGVATAFLYGTQTGGGTGYINLIGAIPPNVNEPIIFEPDCSFTGNQLKVVLIVTGPQPDWGGAQIWGSVDGTSYGQLGTIYQGATQGLLTATFPSGSDPDTVNTLSVDVSMSGQQIDTASTIDADLGVTLAYVDGELVGYSNVTLTSTDNYDLDTYLRRGVYNSTVGSHLTGTQFGLVDGNIFTQVYSPLLVGSTVYFKFLSFNTVGGSLQDISSVVAYDYTLTGSGFCLTKVNCRTLTTGASTTLSVDDDYLLNVAKTVGSATTVNGPAGPVPDGTSFEIADMGNGGLGDANVNPITFLPAGGILVAGLSEFVYKRQGGSFKVTYCTSEGQWTLSAARTTWFQPDY